MALWLLCLCLRIQGILAINFRLYNSCPFTIWPAWLSNADAPALSNGGTVLHSYSHIDLQAPSTEWGGRFWGRRNCKFQQGEGCSIGDCNKQFSCNGIGGAPPFTIAEFKLHGYADKDYYDVSLVDGYDLPMRITPSNAQCHYTGCLSDINQQCPSELQVKDNSGVVGCKSACLAFGSPEYCCTGQYSSANTCGPTEYSRIFKNICPLAYSYPFDDSSSTFTCPSGGDYTITFCP